MQGTSGSGPLIGQIGQRLVGDQEAQELVVGFLDLMQTGNWLASFVERLIIRSSSHGPNVTASDPGCVWRALECSLTEFEYALEGARKVHQNHPEAFADPEAWALKMKGLRNADTDSKTDDSARPERRAA